MIKRLLLAVCVVVSSAAFAADMHHMGIRALTAPARPVTSLHVTKSGANAVLTWTCDQPGMVFRVQRGICHPEFHSRVILAVTAEDATTYTDTGALTSTVLGTATQFFWIVDAIPAAGGNPYANRTMEHEWLEERNSSQIVEYELTNGAIYSTQPKAVVSGRDNDWPIPGAAPSSAGPWLMETENAPTPGGVTDRTVVIRNETEEYPLTVDHNGLYAGAAFVAVAGDQTAPANTARSVPVPTATRDGNTVTIEWVDPTTDTAGTVRSVSIYRGYEGTGDGEATLRGTVAVGTTTFTDSIADVPSGYYIFYTTGLVFSDGHTTPHSAIAADGTGAIVK